MPNVMESAAAWLGSQLKTIRGSVVSIDYGEVRVTLNRDEESLTGWCSRQQYDVIDNEGFATSAMSYDWQFVADDLPEDLLGFASVVINKGEECYESMPIGDRPWFERLDTEGKIVTIHTKQVK